MPLEILLSCMFEAGFTPSECETFQNYFLQRFSPVIGEDGTSYTPQCGICIRKGAKLAAAQQEALDKLKEGICEDALMSAIHVKLHELGIIDAEDEGDPSPFWEWIYPFEGRKLN